MAAPDVEQVLDGGAEVLRRLEADLRREVRGEVRFDNGARALYAADASNYRQIPLGVVTPSTKDDVVATVEICRRHDVPILPRGAGTSLAGQCCNVAVVIDCSKNLDGVLSLSPHDRRARVLPGTILDTLRSAANDHGLTFAPDPATHAYCTLGGMLGNNSCGAHSLMAGRTSDNVDSLEILTYDGLRLEVGATSSEQLRDIINGGGRRGQIYRDMRDLRDRFANLIRARYPKLPRRVSGYNLDDLLPENGFHVARALVGSEGTLVTVLEARLVLVPWPAHRALLVIGYSDIFAAADQIVHVLSLGPMAVEGIDARLVRYIDKKDTADEALQRLPRGKAFLLAEFGADSKEEATAKAHEAAARVRAEGATDTRVLAGAKDQHQLWSVRESGLGATARVPGEKDTWEGWEDSAVPVEKLGGYLRALSRMLEQHGFEAALYGHFGQGCVHTRIPFDFRSDEGVKRYRAFMQDAADLVIGFGGSLSGEHGDGQARAEYLGKLFGDELVGAFAAFKRIWDPGNRMNPGKVVNASASTDNLRLRVPLRPAPETHFRFPNDDGSFLRATERCVGVGKCRRLDGGTMCPSFMVLREEEHTTRGRAHLLYEMLRGGHRDGWRDDHVRRSLDLCLSCKACKSECPVGVDVATYKAEFLAHYYEGRLRPRAAYTMGFVDKWARLARIAPGVANLIAHAPGLSRIAKRIGHIASAREVPRFAAETFTTQFRRAAREAPRGTGERGAVVLWPDTFTNHFCPGVAMSAASALTRLGYSPQVPHEPVCCGRPLYDWGFLDAAKRKLRRTLQVLRAPLRAGLPIVVLEPSCLSVFRDEARSLFPDDEDVRRLSRQARSFAELLARDDVALPALPARALVQGHCHQRALLGMENEGKVLARMQVDHQVLDAGCCGMAGAFGFEQGEKHDISVRAAERRLLPEVRAAGSGTRLVSDGFSCREQIRQLAGRRAVHLAELVDEALRTHEPAQMRQARLHVNAPAEVSVPLASAIGLATGLLALGGVLARSRRARGALAMTLLAKTSTIISLSAIGFVAMGIAAVAFGERVRRRERSPAGPHTEESDGKDDGS